MKYTTTGELSCMEVINLCDGSRMGYPSDFEINTSDGSITAVLVPGENGGILGIGKSKEYRIPWCKIECFGDDTILVKLSGQELSGCECACVSGRRKKGFFH